MTNSVLFVACGEPKVGRESMANELLATAIKFWSKQQGNKQIDSFEPVLLQPHGGDLTLFFLIRGQDSTLEAIRRSDEFMEIESRGTLCLNRMSVLFGRVNEGLQKAMMIWQKNIPAK